MFLTYNGPHQVFAFVDTTFTFELGGTVKMKVKVSTFNPRPYQTVVDVCRMILEVVFVLLLVVNMMAEIYEMLVIYRKYGDIWSYCDCWNFVDWINMITFCWVVWIWSVEYNGILNEYTPQIRYNVYNDLFSQANHINDVNQSQFEALVHMFHQTKVIFQFQNQYMTMNGLAIVIVMLRLLKVLDFQPKLGLITKTIAHALDDLIHFGVIFVLVIGVYTFQSYYLFGSSIQAFSSVGLAFNTNFNMLMGDNAENNSVFELRPFAGALFVYSFIMIVFFVLLNILLAILVEAYMKVALEDLSYLILSLDSNIQP